MKIGILTFHNAHNYGAVLQAYALKKKISQLGHNVEIVNYRNKIAKVQHYCTFAICFFNERNPGWGLWEERMYNIQ